MQHGRTADMVWPRSPHDPWYSNYGMIVTAMGVLVLGIIYMAAARPYDHGNAPAGDAHLSGRHAMTREPRRS
jgi:hypothetical protein